MDKGQPGFSAKRLILSLLVIIIVAVAAAFGTYAWQNGKVKDLESKVRGLNTQLTSLSGQITSLSSQLNSACKNQPVSANNICANYSYSSSKGVDVLILTPAKNAKVSSPIAVIGEVPGNWSFEAQFPIVLKDDTGNILAKTTAKVLGDWMTGNLVPFSAQLAYTPPAGGSGTIILQKDNPSGLPANADSVAIPVQF